MQLRAIARMIQTMLYAKRFFPYYVYNILGGIEEDGEPLFLLFIILISPPLPFMVCLGTLSHSLPFPQR